MNFGCRLFKKVSEARRALYRSFDIAQDRLEAYEQYVEARGSSATKPMRLFQQSATRIQ